MLLAVVAPHPTGPYKFNNPGKFKFNLALATNPSHKTSQQKTTPEGRDILLRVCCWWWLPRLPHIQLLPLAANHHANLARRVGRDGSVPVAHAAPGKHLQQHGSTTDPAVQQYPG